MKTDTSTNQQIYSSCKTEIIELKIHGTITTYQERIWVDDDNMEHGGSFQYVTKKYTHPKILIRFEGIVDIYLEIGCTYSDGKNNFIAVTKHKIFNVYREVDSFEVPKELAMICKPFSEGQVQKP